MQHSEPQSLEDVNRDQDAPSLGQILKRAREAQGIALEHVCAELRFEQRLLEALEDDRLDELGPPVFAKGYIKHYGQRVGLSYDDLLARYYDAVGSQDVVIEPSRAIKLRDERQVTVWIIAAAALALIGVVLFVWWSNEAFEPVEFPPPARSTDAPADSVAAVGVDVPRDAPAATSRDGTSASDDASGGAGDGEGAAAAGAASRPGDAEAGGVAPNGRDTEAGRDAAAGAAEPAEPGPGRETGARAAEPGPTGETAAALDPGPVAPGATDVASPVDSDDNGTPASAGATRLELVFAEDSWAEVTDARGEQLMYGLARAGEREAVTGAGPLSVLLGNASGVRVRVDGEPYAVPSAARRGDLAEFTVGESEN